MMQSKQQQTNFTNDANDAFSKTRATVASVDSIHSMHKRKKISNFSVPSKATNRRVYFNKYSSYLVANQTSDELQVLQNLSTILIGCSNAYQYDIEFTVDTIHKQINGLVFVTDYYFVHFSIAVGDGHIQYGRTSGDSLASAKFWDQIKQHYANSGKLNHHYFDFIRFDLHCDDMYDGNHANGANDEFSLNQCLNVFDRVNVALTNNDCFALDELFIFYSTLRENDQSDALTMTEALFTHSLLMNSLSIDVWHTRTSASRGWRC
jgi:hypothetical protein